MDLFHVSLPEAGKGQEILKTTLVFRIFQIWLKLRKTVLNLAEEGYGSGMNTESEGRFGISLLITVGGGRGGGALWHNHAPRERPGRAGGAPRAWSVPRPWAGLERLGGTGALGTGFSWCFREAGGFAGCSAQPEDQERDSSAFPLKSG